MAVMKIEAKYRKDLVKTTFSSFKARLEKVILRQLIYVGEQFIINVRNTKTYKDRTSNLRNSLSYVIIKDGVQIVGDLGSGIGSDKSLNIIHLVAADYPTGYLLIGVAGMEYAAAVEAKGFDVITGGAQIAENALRQAFDRLRTQINEL